MVSINIIFPKEHFFSGDFLQGDLLLSVTDPRTPHYDISGIYLLFQGVERVRFRRRASISHESDAPIEPDWEVENGRTVRTGIPTILPISQPHFSQKILICTTHPLVRHRGKLQRGIHSFPFTIALPGQLPSSISFASGSSSKYYASVEYNLTAQVFAIDSGDPGFTLTVPIKIIAKSGSCDNIVKTSHHHRHHHQNQKTNPSIIPFIDQRIEISHALCFCFPSKEFNFYANWTLNTFSAGQEVKLVLRLSLAPFSGTCRVKLVSVKLVRELVLSVEGQQFRTVDPITKSKFRVEGALLSDSVGFELCTSTSLTIPSNLQEPTCKTDSIDCRYFFVFEVDFKLYESILLASEVIIAK